MKAKRRGYLLPVLIVVVVVLWGLSELLAGARERVMRTRCVGNLGALAYMQQVYSGDHGEAFPPTPGHLYPSYIPDGGVFLCPSVRKATPIRRQDCPGEGYPPATFGDTHTDYVYVSGLRTSDPKHYILAFDDEWNHDGDGVYAISTRDTRVEWIRDLERLHEQLEKQEKELAAKGRETKLLRPAWSSWPDPPAGWPPPWYARRGWRAVAVGASVALAAALALFVRAARRGRTPSGD